MRINSITTPYNYPKSPSMKGKYTPKKCVSAPLVAAPLIKLSPVISKILFNNIIPTVLSVLFFNFLPKLVAKFHQKPVKLEQEIEYKEAKTLKEAKVFAKKNFKIKKFKVDDLGVANWINEGLSILCNKFKGDVYMPRKIKYTHFAKDNVGGDYDILTDCLRFNKIPNEVLDAKLISRDDFIDSAMIDKYPIITNYKSFEDARKNMKNLSAVEKWSLANDMSKMNEVTPSKNQWPELMNKMMNIYERDLFGPVYTGKFGVLFHEMGHVFDMKSSKDNRKACKIKEQFFQKHKQGLVLPNYARSNYSEFIAETFAGIMSGGKYSKKLLDLFNSLTNIKLPNA